MAKRLEGKTALITGAAHGQGRAHAVRFAREGADVIVTDLGGPSAVDVDYDLGTTSELEETVRLIEQEGQRGYAGTADIRDRAALQALRDATAEEFPKLDIIVANAGVTGHGRILEVTPEQWDQHIGINLTGAFNTIQTFLPRMLEGGTGGSIVITSSVAGMKGLPFFAAYSSAKHGLQGLMAVLAQELAEHAIRVNTVNPGPVGTPMTQNDSILKLFTDDKTMALFQGSFTPMLPLPAEGWMDPEDVTNAVLWLASDESRNVTGHAIPVDAGVMVR
jgi:SDR family mycofactocin-dependent oxidoreductase